MNLKTVSAGFLLGIFLLPLSTIHASSSQDTAGTIERLHQLIALLQKQLAHLNQDTSKSDTAEDLALISPDGGERYVEGGPIAIKWTPKIPGVSTIELVPEAKGETITMYAYKVMGYSTNRDGVWNTKIPLGYTGKYRVRITGPDGRSDESDKSFYIKKKIRSDKSIMEPLTVTYPRGDEVFGEGQKINIGWMPNGIPSAPGITKIELLSLDDGENTKLYPISKSDSPIYDGHFQVKLPRPIDESGGGDYKIRITDANGKTDMSEIFTLNAKG